LRKSSNSKRLKQRNKLDIRIPRLIRHSKNLRKGARDTKDNYLS